MRKIIKWSHWELKNEFLASGYFTGMFFWYCIIQLLTGSKHVDIFIVGQMFLTNYVLSTLHSIFLNEDKVYPVKSFMIRGTILSIVSILAVILASELGGWFHNKPLWASISTYLLLILSYITVWIMFRLNKKYDTDELNEQLAYYKGIKK